MKEVLDIGKQFILATNQETLRLNLSPHLACKQSFPFRERGRETTDFTNACGKKLLLLNFHSQRFPSLKHPPFLSSAPSRRSNLFSIIFRPGKLGWPADNQTLSTVHIHIQSKVALQAKLPLYLGFFADSCRCEDELDKLLSYSRPL